jgi:hypothetical protein
MPSKKFMALVIPTIQITDRRPLKVLPSRVVSGMRIMRTPIKVRPVARTICIVNFTWALRL